MHGGGAPQVKAKAKERLLALVDPALAVIHSSLQNYKKEPALAQRAAEDILDRAGLKAAARHEVSTPWNGDWRTLTDEQLDNMLESYRQMHGLSAEDMERQRLKVMGLDPGQAVHDITDTVAAPTPTDAPPKAAIAAPAPDNNRLLDDD